ncbi:MAG: C40 family peptidase [Spirosomataceae bacterium]
MRFLPLGAGLVLLFCSFTHVPDPIEVGPESIIRYAKKFIGTRYQRGGKTPRGFDCSGYVRYVFKRFDISLGAHSGHIFKTGIEVDKYQARAGDLIFFRSTQHKSINHVGIVVSADSSQVRFIHSSTSKGVMISQLNSAYYKKRFAGVRRIPQLAQE